MIRVDNDRSCLTITHSEATHAQVAALLRILREFGISAVSATHNNIKTSVKETTDGSQMVSAITINPSDILVVNVLNAPRDRPIEGERTVRSDGKITLGSYGDVYVAGLTLPELKARLVLHLRKYFSDIDLGITSTDFAEASCVEVTLAGRNSASYHVSGLVKTPGAFPLYGNQTVLDALQASGGLDHVTKADVAIRLVRAADNGEQPKTLPIDLYEILKQGNSNTNYTILPGDRIYVYSTNPPTDSPDEPVLAPVEQPK